jgi:hypothetical protein
MRLRNQVVDFGAVAASACAARVCQPLPLARQAASTSGSRRRVTGALCTVCTGRPAARRARICSGVWTRPTPPASPCSTDRNNAASNSRISGSAWGSIFLLGIQFLLDFYKHFRADVVELGFGIHQQQNNFTAGQAVEVNHPRTASLTHAMACPAHFAQTARAGNHVASQRVLADEVNEFNTLSIAPDSGRPSHEFRGFDDGVHEFIVHRIIDFNAQLCRWGRTVVPSKAHGLKNT